MGRTRTCGLCGATIKQNVAAHPCPHGQACRYQVDDEGMPVDWSSPACSDCRGLGTNLRALPGFALTDKAHAAFDPE